MNSHMHFRQQIAFRSVNFGKRINPHVIMCLHSRFFCDKPDEWFYTLQQDIIAQFSMTQTAKLLHVDANDLILLERIYIQLLPSLVWQRLADS